MNKILLGNCLELMKDIPSGSIDMILCDLPYGTTACKWDQVIPFEPLWEQYERIIKDNGAIVLTAAQPFTSALVMSNPKLFKYDLTWDKKQKVGMLNCKRMPLRQHEDILVFYKKLPTYNPQMTKGKYRNKKIAPKNGFTTYGQLNNSEDNYNDLYYPTSLLEFSNAHQKIKQHPTQKPVVLFEYLIKTYTNEGETVLDNCAGSGTTAIACLNTKRNYICMEKDPEYFDIIKGRIKEYHRQPIFF